MRPRRFIGARLNYIIRLFKIFRLDILGELFRSGASMRGQICCLLSGNNESFGCQETSHVPEARCYDINMRTITYTISAGLFVKQSTYLATYEDVFKSRFRANYYHNLPITLNQHFPVLRLFTVVEKMLFLAPTTPHHHSLSFQFFLNRLLLHWRKFLDLLGFPISSHHVSITFNFNFLMCP